MTPLCTASMSAALRTNGERVISRMRTGTGLAVAALALIGPTALRGQGLNRSASAPTSGPFERVARAGVGAPPFSPAAFVRLTRSAEVARGDTTVHHGSRAHHAAVGALIGGAVGLVVGVIADRPGGLGLGRGEQRGGHFNNLWLVTAPVGATIGALAGTLRQAD